MAVTSRWAPAMKSERVKTKTRKSKAKKYGHYASYREYSESIIMQPARELFNLLENQETKKR